MRTIEIDMPDKSLHFNLTTLAFEKPCELEHYHLILAEDIDELAT